MRNYLDQAGLWASLRGILLITNRGGKIHPEHKWCHFIGFGPELHRSGRSELSTRSQGAWVDETQLTFRWAMLLAVWVPVTTPLKWWTSLLLVLWKYTVFVVYIYVTARVVVLFTQAGSQIHAMCCAAILASLDGQTFPVPIESSRSITVYVISPWVKQSQAVVSLLLLLHITSMILLYCCYISVTSVTHWGRPWWQAIVSAHLSATGTHLGVKETRITLSFTRKRLIIWKHITLWLEDTRDCFSLQRAIWPQKLYTQYKAKIMSCFGSICCQNLERAKYIFSGPKAAPLGYINTTRRSP